MIEREDHPRLGDASRPFIGGRTVPISNDNDGPFGKGVNELPKGEPLGGSNSGHPRDQNLKSYFTKVVGPWIKPTWNLW